MTEQVNAPASGAGTEAAAPAVVLPPVPPEMLRTTRIYELMLLFEPAEAQRAWDKLVDWAKDIIAKARTVGGTALPAGLILKTEQWADSRKLAYEVKGTRRGTYLVVYFRQRPAAVNDVQNDFRLDERVIRHMLVMHEKEPDALTGKVRQRAPDEFEDDYDRRRDDYGFDDDDYDDY